METAQVNASEHGIIGGMNQEEVMAEIARVQGEIEDHRREIEGKAAWVKQCKARLATMV